MFVIAILFKVHRLLYIRQALLKMLPFKMVISVLPCFFFVPDESDEEMRRALALSAEEAKKSTDLDIGV